MNLKDWIKGNVVAMDASARPWASASALNGWIWEFWLFGLKQAWASLFAGAMLFLLMATHAFWSPHFPCDPLRLPGRRGVGPPGRHAGDARLERWEEVAVIAIFHVVGTAMEVFKTAHGSWIYPEHSFLRIGGVPLFTGFMYAGVGSYMARTWRLMDIRFERFPPLWQP